VWFSLEENHAIFFVYTATVKPLKRSDSGGSMTAKHVASTAMRAVRTGLGIHRDLPARIGSAFAAGQTETASSRDADTSTPIKHVIVIIGENRSFDHVFATYVPKKGRDGLESSFRGNCEGRWNARPELSAGGTESSHRCQAARRLFVEPNHHLVSGSVLPAPLNGGPTDSYVKDDSLTLAVQSENGLPADYYAYLVTGGSGLTGKVPDTRIKNVNALPPGPFQLTNGDTFTYNSTRPARCTVSTRCGSSWIAALPRDGHQSFRLRRTTVSLG
jgi:phospholipase C